MSDVAFSFLKFKVDRKARGLIKKSNDNNNDF